MTSIAILGSLNADLVVNMDRFPGPGETVVARSFNTYSGGKGANQAAACGRAGGDTAMFGAVGDDDFGRTLVRSLTDSDVIADNILRCPDVHSGLAHIWVENSGENSIAIVPGANARVDQDYIDSVFPKINDAKLILLQLEIPLDAMAYLLNKIGEDGPMVILDPAPAMPLDELPTQHIWLLTPNEHELSVLTGRPTDNEKNIEAACSTLLDHSGAGAVICKAGSRGAYLHDGSDFQHYPGYKVRTVDSTAAGDAFNAALAVALSENQSIKEAIKWANAAGALAVTKPGAQNSLPWRAEVDEFLRTHS